MALSDVADSCLPPSSHSHAGHVQGSAAAALALRFVVSRPLWSVGSVVCHRIISHIHQALLHEHDSFKRYYHCKSADRPSGPAPPCHSRPPRPWRELDLL